LSRQTDNLASTDTGSPIYYQGILAGEVLGWELGNDRKSIFIHAFVKAPYNMLVKSNTRFWNISGVDVTVDSDGISVHTESLQSLLYGGIAFETPDTLEQIKEEVDGLAFTLFDDYQSIKEKAFVKKVLAILFFNGSVRGLNIGAPVEFKGIKVGMVKDIRLEFDGQDASFKIPVLVEIEPERFIAKNEQSISTPMDMLNTLVEKGLRARLQTGSLLTGQLFVELDMHPDTVAKFVHAKVPYPELPTIPANLEQMTASVKNILDKMEKLNIEDICSQLLHTLEGTNQIVSFTNTVIQKHEMESTVTDFKKSLALLKNILQKMDQRVSPIAENLENAIGASHDVLKKTQATLTLVDQSLSPNSPLQFNFLELTTELTGMARSIRILVDMLERNPNSIIFGKDIPGEK